MTFTDLLISTFSTTALVGVALWLLRTVITTRLTASVQHEFNGRLETLRTELHKSEELFRAELRSKETEIAALRGGAMAGMANRQAVLDNRRLEAVDQLWSAVYALLPGKAAATFIAGFKFEPTAELAAKNAKFRTIFEGMAAQVDKQKMQSDEASKARPFVSPLAWSLFSAYQAIIWFAVTKITILKSGIDVKGILDSSSIENLIKAALPHRAEYVAEHGPIVYHYLLDELESQLLVELRRMLDGHESDAASVEKAAAILKQSNSVMEKLTNGGAAGATSSEPHGVAASASGG